MVAHLNARSTRIPSFSSFSELLRIVDELDRMVDTLPIYIVCRRCVREVDDLEQLLGVTSLRQCVNYRITRDGMVGVTIDEFRRPAGSSGPFEMYPDDPNKPGPFDVFVEKLYPLVEYVKQFNQKYECMDSGKWENVALVKVLMYARLAAHRVDNVADVAELFRRMYSEIMRELAWKELRVYDDERYGWDIVDNRFPIHAYVVKERYFFGIAYYFVGEYMMFLYSVFGALASLAKMPYTTFSIRFPYGETDVGVEWVSVKDYYRDWKSGKVGKRVLVLLSDGALIYINKEPLSYRNEYTYTIRVLPGLLAHFLLERPPPASWAYKTSEALENDEEKVRRFIDDVIAEAERGRGDLFLEWYRQQMRELKSRLE